MAQSSPNCLDTVLQHADLRADKLSACQQCSQHYMTCYKWWSLTEALCLQSSLLGLLLASKFFGDTLICLPCGISVIVMTLVGICAMPH